jgi:hypothetical protein
MRRQTNVHEITTMTFTLSLPDLELLASILL